MRREIKRVGYDARCFRIFEIKELRWWAEQPVVVGYTARASMEYGHPLHEALHDAFEAPTPVEILGICFEVVACDWNLTFTASQMIFHLCSRGDPWEHRRN